MEIRAGKNEAICRQTEVGFFYKNGVLYPISTQFNLSYPDSHYTISYPTMKSFFPKLFSSSAASNLIEGIVCLVASGRSKVLVPGVDKPILCSYPSFNSTLLVGDNVSVDLSKSRICSVQVRRSLVHGKPQVANASTYVHVLSLRDLKLMSDDITLSRELCSAALAAKKLDYVLVLSQRDAVSEEIANSVEAKLRSWGYSPIVVSVSDKAALKTLRESLSSSNLFGGPVGSGKSSLINSLRTSLPNPDGALELAKVGKVSDAPKKKLVPTTTSPILYPFKPGVTLIDSQAVNRSLRFRVDPEGLSRLFPELKSLKSEGCSCCDKKCLHLSEDGCAVYAKFKDGTFPRYVCYTHLMGEVLVD